ncbi:MAG: tyrosine-protein phosphatase [Sciscionella sp.]
MNARDLGGLPTADAGCIRERALIRSDRPSRLTDDGVEAVRRLRPSRIIDLRTAAQCEREPSPFAAADMYCHVPLSIPFDSPVRELHSARSGTMASTLTYLRDEFSGIEPYLRRGGLVERQLKALRERLVVRSRP